MDDQRQSQELFYGQLTALTKAAREQGMFVTEEQVKDSFPDMELNEDKLALIYEYLKQHNIAVGGQSGSMEALTEEEAGYLGIYEQGLKNLPVYTDREADRIYIEAFSGNADAKEKLIHMFLPKVVEISRLYTGQGVLIEDLIGEGNMAVAMAMDLFDCLEKPDEMEGFLSKMIMDAMEKCIADEWTLSRQDEQMVGKVNRIADAAKQLSEDLKRPVSVAELAGETEFTEEEIREVLAITGYHIKEIEGSVSWK